MDLCAEDCPCRYTAVVASTSTATTSQASHSDPVQYHPYQTSSQPKARQNLNFEQKLQVLEFYHLHKHKLSMDAMVAPLRQLGFQNITQSSISRTLKAEDKIRAYVASGGGDAKRGTLVTLPEVEAELVRWIDEEGGLSSVRGEDITTKARELCDTLGIAEDRRIKFSKGWLTGFKKRHGLVWNPVTEHSPSPDISGLFPN